MCIAVHTLLMNVYKGMFPSVAHAGLSHMYLFCIVAFEFSETECVLLRPTSVAVELVDVVAMIVCT